MTGNLVTLWYKATQSPLPRLLFVVLLLLLAYQLACLTWYWLSPPWKNSVYAVVENSEKQSVGVGVAVFDIDTISRYQLFGKRVQQVAVVDEPVTAPETKLKLELRGVIATGDEEGAAIIADDRKREGYYRVGDELPGDVLLHEVFADKVILDRNGRYETLSLPSERMEFSDEKGDNTPATGRISAEATETLYRYREILLNDPQQLIGAVRTFPVRRNGQLMGYRIAPGRDRTLLTKFGLRPGDIVTAVNGISLNSPANGLAVMQKLNSAQSLSLEVERNGRSQSFQFSLN